LHCPIYDSSAQDHEQSGWNLPKKIHTSFIANSIYFLIIMNNVGPDLILYYIPLDQDQVHNKVFEIIKIKIYLLSFIRKLAHTIEDGLVLEKRFIIKFCQFVLINFLDFQNFFAFRAA
jgi:hypothetical protein